MIIGIGCDLTVISRFKKNKDSLAKKILSANELLEYNSYPGKRQFEFLAGRFAAR
ncbi:UNVERIFIED_CONTAM: phosphopantetheine--protein transferase-like protein [Murimonas intestini]|uniref:Phosphopantetheine--protein transferase-like protein n=1 Tax=Murimonas intestini TaxID=1337051 RepID=A0AB73T549_9FIRM